MKIILDVMGADKPASELIRGAILAKEEYGTDIVLVGNESVIREALAEEQASEGSFEIVHADDVVTMEDDTMSIFQTHKEASMAKTLRLVAEGYGDAAVSAGNTGAYFTGATLIVKRIRGIRRAALGTILPYASPVLLLDCGANVTVSADYLAQFACLGSVYMEKVFGIESPRVGLVNNGTEPSVERYEGNQFHRKYRREGISLRQMRGARMRRLHGQYHSQNQRGALPFPDGKGAGDVPFRHDQHAFRRACARKSEKNEEIL